MVYGSTKQINVAKCVCTSGTPVTAKPSGSPRLLGAKLKSILPSLLFSAGIGGLFPFWQYPFSDLHASRINLFQRTDVWKLSFLISISGENFGNEYVLKTESICLDVDSQKSFRIH